MTSRPDISVIIPTFNRPELLRRTLQTLSAQSLAAERFEVIVCDDGSTGDTASVVRGYEPALDIRYFYQPDRGFRAAAARNAGIALARSAVCLFVDDGLLLGERCVEEHLRSHREAVGETTVVGDVCGYEWTGEHDAIVRAIADEMPVDDAIDALDARGLSDPRTSLYASEGADLTGWPAPWVIWWSMNVSVSSAALDRVGGFDESFTTWGGEDNELAVRLFAEGVEYRLNPAARALHFPHVRHHTMQTAAEESRVESDRKKSELFAKDPLESVGLWRTVGTFALNEALRTR
jgi:GT2 family glycosyltransferase